MSVKGNKRKQLIEEWLRGEENSEYEVKPTRREGKYIIRKRDKSAERINPRLPDFVRSEMKKISQQN